MKTCSIEGCGKRHQARGLCKMHYHRLLRHGSEHVTYPNKHGHTNHNSRAYRTWQSMRRRCNDPNQKDYKRYGARGIYIDPRWDSFAVFLADMGEPPSNQHSLDRIDNAGPYSPENCQWATASTQAHNRRNTKLTQAQVDQIRYEYAATTTTQSALAQRFNLSQSHICRILRGEHWQ